MDSEARELARRFVNAGTSGFAIGRHEVRTLVLEKTYSVYD